MPRSRGGAGPSRPSAPSRPTAPSSIPARSAPQQQQSRPMSTTTAPAQQHAPPPAAAQQGPGLFGQMASTAAGVAVGSSIGHAVGGWFGGGSSSSQQQAYPEQQVQHQDNFAQPGQAMDSGMYQATSGQSSSAQQGGACAVDVKNFTQCMEQNRGDLNVCGWYLEQLKACQAAARGY